MHVRVKVSAGAKRERLVQETSTSFTMTVKEPAERNLANKRVRELLADAFDVPIRQVRLVTGHHSGSKLFSVELATI